VNTKLSKPQALDFDANWHTIYTRMNRWSKNGVLDEHCTQSSPAAR
jgi:hypothetical protein